MSDKQPPETVYLQWDDETLDMFVTGVTWCEDRINDDDVEYVLESKLEAAEARASRFDLAHGVVNTERMRLTVENTRLRDRIAELEAALNKIAHDHVTQAKYGASGDWHGLFNWAQDIAKQVLKGGAK